MAVYAADFETTTNPDDCRVWAWCICDIYNIDETIEYGETIYSFIEYISNLHGKIYFHNLKFDMYSMKLKIVSPYSIVSSML